MLIGGGNNSNVKWCYNIISCQLHLQFGIEDLKALPNQTGCWDGVRNYQVDCDLILCLSRSTCRTITSAEDFPLRHVISWEIWRWASRLSFTTVTAKSQVLPASWRWGVTPKEDEHFYRIHNNSEWESFDELLFLQIVKEAYVDHTQFDKKDAHYDPSSKADNPKWSMVCFYTDHK